MQARGTERWSAADLRTNDAHLEVVARATEENLGRRFGSLLVHRVRVRGARGKGRREERAKCRRHKTSRSSAECGPRAPMVDAWEDWEGVPSDAIPLKKAEQAVRSPPSASLPLIFRRGHRGTRSRSRSRAHSSLWIRPSRRSSLSAHCSV